MVGKPNNKLKFTVGSIEIDLYVDSGAEVSIVTEETWKMLRANKIKVKEFSQDTNKKIAGITESASLAITGSFTAEVTSINYKTDEKFYIAKKNATENILSGEACKKKKNGIASSLVTMCLRPNKNQSKGSKLYQITR